MTALLKKAFEKVSKLPGSDQNAFARWVLDELASEQRWNEAFANSEDLLSQLADEAV